MKIIFDNDPNEYKESSITLNMEEFKNLFTFILWQGTDFEITPDNMDSLRENVAWQVWNLLHRDKDVLKLQQEFLGDGGVNFIQ